MKQSDLLNSPKNWAEDFEHENGNYMNKCNSCKHQFLGHKRRFVCKQCIEQQIVGELLEGEHPDEIYPRAGSWLQERRNWAAQVKKLEEYASLARKQVLEEIEEYIIERSKGGCDSISNSVLMAKLNNLKK